MADLAYNTTLRTLVCSECAIQFAIPAEFYDRRKNDHKVLWCPAGHQQVFSGESREARLAAEVERLKQAVEAAAIVRRTEEHRLRTQLGKARAKAQRLERRTNAGVCPHCQRTVKQMAAHIRTQHPEVTVPLPLREVQ